MKLKQWCLGLSMSLATVFGQAQADDKVIRVGEINSYKTIPAFLEPYKKGIELAVDQINESGGIHGKKLEVILRDDGGNQGSAIREAQSLITRDKVDLLAGSFLSHIALALADFAQQKKIFFLAGEPLTDKMVWENKEKGLQLFISDGMIECDGLSEKDLGFLGENTEDEKLNIINQLFSKADLSGTSVRKPISDMTEGYDYYDTEVLLNGIPAGGLSQYHYQGSTGLVPSLKTAILKYQSRFR